MADHLIAFWNVENLFGPENHPPRIDWVAKRMAADLAGWTEALYKRKLNQLAQIIVQMRGRAGPDILGVCEVEDRQVLLDLSAVLNAKLPARRYGVVHADNTRDKRGIDTAFVYDETQFTVNPATIFNHWIMRRTGTRDILQATFRTKRGNDLILMCNHWPSRSGDIDSSPFRRTAGETLGYWHMRSREETSPRAAVLALGDFNDDPFDLSLREHASAWREKGDISRAESARFYNLAWEYLEVNAVDRNGKPRVLEGTLYYNDNGNVFDQILISPPFLDGKGPFRLIEDTVRIEAFSEMVSHRVGEGPIRFGLPKGNAALNINPDGFSDHFPVSVMVAEDETIV